MGTWFRVGLLAASLLSCALNIPIAVAAPTGSDEHELFNSSHPFAEFGLTGHAARADKVELRILSLGASIMSGMGSSTGNGLRKPLRDALRKDGWSVNMVGSLHGGTMQDYDHEAVPGDVLTQVLARVPRSTGFKPNVVIINAGTNDGNGNIDLSNVGARMNNVLNALWNADGMSSTCIMVSTLIPTTNANGAANRGNINNQYRALVKQRAGEGKCVYIADMDPNGQVWLDLNTEYLAGEEPKVHPNDAGHKKMAAVFYQAINKAISDNRIVAPGTFNLGSGTCDKFAGTGIDAGGRTQRGSGYDDGIYLHNSEEKGVLWSADSDWDRGQWKFARLFDRNYDDLVAWISSTTTSQVYAVWANSGDGKGGFNKLASDLIPDLDCQYTSGVHFIDMNGDGLDDLVYIDADGNAYLSVNQGDGNRGAGKPPTFKRVSATAKIKDSGGERSRIVLADIDGDGRGDYGVTDGSGNIVFWRNGGTGNIPAYWQNLGQRWTAKGYGDALGTRFEDVNGDGRDDFVWLNDVGAGYIWTNGRSCAKGSEGNGLNVAWRQGFHTGESSGTAYKGMGSYVTKDETFLRDRIHFARIYGQSTIFGNLPTQDYVFLQHEKLSSGKHRFSMRVWKNTGGGGSKLLADGNRYCNMMGHSNGMVDYVWIYSFGRMEMWANRGKGFISESDPDGYWNYQGTIWTPPSNLNRKNLHLEDWDGDGDCDIIYSDPNTGAVQVWINNYSSNGGKWDWTYLANPAPGVTCSQKQGLGIFDLGVRFADITGNRRADYLCIEPNSRITGYVHKDDGSWEHIDQIKVSIDKDRANLRFADVNGDGKDDLLWIEKFSGDTFVWYNEGRGDPAVLLGSSFSWRQQNAVAYAGLAAGTCEYFADLNGDGFPDEHYILGTFNNQAMTSIAPGCGLTDRTGDDASMDGSLPTVPGSGTGGGGDNGGGGGGGGGNGDFDLGQYLGIIKGSKPDVDRGNCSTMQFRCFTCDNAEDRDIVNVLTPPYNKWNTSLAQSSVLHYWGWWNIHHWSGSIGDAPWDLAMAYFYDTNKELSCRVGGSENFNCWADFGCDGEQYSLSAYLVLTSYVRFFRFYQAWWDALDHVLNEWGSLSDDFSDTFVHKDSDDLTDQLNAWLMGTVLEAISGKLWSTFAPKLKLPDDGDEAEVAKGVYEDAYTAATDKLMEVMGLDGEEDEPADMSELATTVVQKQKKAVETYANWVLSGEDDQAIRQFNGQVNDGTWLSRGNDTTDDVRATAKKMTMSQLIPLAWSYGGKLWPTIYAVDKADDTSNPLNGIDDGDAKAMRVTYDGKTFWAVGVRKCTSRPQGGCSDSAYTTLDGFDELDGTHDEWGKLTLEEMLKSSWDGFKLNGRKNGFDIMSQGDSKTLDAAGAKSKYDFVNGVLSPGYVSLPICNSKLISVNLAALNYVDTEKCSYFPCCECETFGDTCDSSYYI